MMLDLFKEIPEEVPENFEEVKLRLLKRIKRDIDRLMLEFERVLTMENNEEA